MAESTQVQRIGNTLFKFRSLTPVPVIVGLAFLLWHSRAEPGPGGLYVDSILNVIGLSVALCGQALRFHTLGLVPEGTSGQGFVLEASTLNQRGPYAHVRNPLYVGNLGICLGLLLIAHDPWVYALGLLFFFGEYFFIIRAEEAFLREKFGPAFDEYRARVPRWIPRLRPAYEGQLRQSFDVRRAVKKEHNPFTAWAVGATVLIYWEMHAREVLEASSRWMLATALLVFILLFVVTKAYKRGLFGKPAAPSP